MARGRSQRSASVDIWPGFVDALSTLLMVIIFLLAVFVLAQFFLSQQLEGRDAAMTRLEETVAELDRQLGLERDTAADLRRNLTRLSTDLRAALAERDAEADRTDELAAERDRLAETLALSADRELRLGETLEAMRLDRQKIADEAEAARAELEAANATIAADRATLEARLAELVQLRRDIDALAQVRAELEAEIAGQADLLAAGETARADLSAELGAVRDERAALEARLADEEERTRLAQRELDEREIRLDELLRSAASLEAALDAEARDREAALAEVELLNRQINALSIQLAEIDNVLTQKETEIATQSATIADLGERLNVALAAQVEELSRFRSDFFGRLRQVLGDRDDVRIVGDRFVFQSEVLFGSGEAEIGPEGRRQLAKLAATLSAIAAEIPDELPWVLQVDGHTDRRPISTARFPSNWELSTARAISVAEFLIEQGIPPERVAARGFAEFQPLDPADTPSAYRRNRRIEIKLTTR
ncbi:MAG: peptidoglycan -binding protein [Geminicoccaceae bacterium]